MSGTDDGAPDPLAALRASDRRPPLVVLRERVAAIDLGFVRSTANRAVVLALVVALGVGVAWRSFIESEPPVEDSIPFATSNAAATITPSSVTEPPTASDPATPIAASSATADSTLPAEPDVAVVHVAGAVLEPGLVTGDSSWRIDDAIRAAGGVARRADLDRVNLAAPIIDGQRVFVPFVDEDVPTIVQPELALSASAEAAASGPVNINTADAAALERLPGVGPATAASIIAHREEFGGFGTVDALVSVPGIGPATLEALRDHISA